MIVQVNADTDFIDGIKKLTGKGHASKALLQTAIEYEEMKLEISRLRDQLRAEENKVYEYRALINSIEGNYRCMQEMIGQGKLL